ncbi:MAG: hypothetical protein ACYDEF_05895 [Methanosarcina sp.]
MPAKRKYELKTFLEVLTVNPLSTGTISRKVKCHISTALRYLRELKAAKQVIEKRISNTINLWKLTGKQVLLLDVDNTIANLALMKISAWHKAKGDMIKLIKLNLKRGEQIYFGCTLPDKVYASIVFKKNKHALDYLVSAYPDIPIDIGGSGYTLTKKLPDEIENLKPDYSLYPDCDYSLGFSSRGCFRKCFFCMVDKKEGKFHRTQHPSEWYDPKFKDITFLDNNILADKAWFMEITSWCIENKLKVQFNQGLDIRLLDMEIAKRLLEMRTHGMVNFAWDHIEDEAVIKEKIQLLRDAGFSNNKLRAKVQFYVYVDSDEEYESGLYRCNELKKLSCNAFVMYNTENENTRRIKALQRWSIRKGIFWQFEVCDYKRAIDTRNSKHRTTA